MNLWQLMLTDDQLQFLSDLFSNIEDDGYYDEEQNMGAEPHDREMFRQVHAAIIAQDNRKREVTGG